MNRLLRFCAVTAVVGLGVDGAAYAADPAKDGTDASARDGGQVVAQGGYSTQSPPAGYPVPAPDATMPAGAPMPAPMPAAAPPAPAPTSSGALNAPAANWKVGPVTLSFVGFSELAGIWRQHDEAADISSSFKLPYENTVPYYTGEFRETARQSRFGLLAQSPFDGVNRAEMYMETDFQSSGSSSNSNQSNSYTLRVRQFYGSWSQPDNGWYLLAGQAWSFATMFKKGLTPRQENVPLTIDATYVPGFTWTRNAQLRFVKTFDDFGVGISLEAPQNISAAAAAVAAGGGSAGAVTGSPGTGTNNPGANYGTEIAPDVIVKLAVDPVFGHYEVFSMTRFFHDRGFGGAAPATTANHTTIAQSIGGGFILPLVPKMLEVQASGLWGRGTGRYADANLPDAAVNPANGSLSPQWETSVLAGVTAHPTKRIDLYAYAGYEHESDGHAAGATYVGCNTAPVGLTGNGVTCTTGTVKQATAGFWWKVYKGPIGYMQLGGQFSATKNKTFVATNGSQGQVSNNMAFVSVRYYPFQ